MHYLELYIYTIDDKIHHIPIFIVADISKFIIQAVLLKRFM